MDKKDNEKKLVSNVKFQAQREEWLKDKAEPSDVLNNGIKEHAGASNCFSVETKTNEVDVGVTLESLKSAIEALRKVSPKKANELENTLALKTKKKKTHSSIRKKP